MTVSLRCELPRPISAHCRTQRVGAHESFAPRRAQSLALFGGFRLRGLLLAIRERRISTSHGGSPASGSSRGASARWQAFFFFFFFFFFFPPPPRPASRRRRARRPAAQPVTISTPGSGLVFVNTYKIKLETRVPPAADRRRAKDDVASARGDRKTPSASLGLAVEFLSKKPAFAKLQFGEWSQVLFYQVARGHFFFVVDQDRRVRGFLGWALRQQALAEQWVEGARGAAQRRMPRGRLRHRQRLCGRHGRRQSLHRRHDAQALCKQAHTLL